MKRNEILKLFREEGLDVDSFEYRYGKEYADVVRDSKRYGVNRNLFVDAMHRYEMGWKIKDIAWYLGTTEKYLKKILPSTIDDTIRDLVLQYRYMGLTIEAIGRELGLKVGSVQNYLKPVRRCVVREEIESGLKRYFVSLAHVMKYHPELRRKDILRIIAMDDSWMGYRFYYEYNVNLLEKI